MAFFQHINYAASHEDGRSELRALALDTDARVLCITGSGARPLDLLTAGPREIVAIDFNPAQSALLELKLAALQALSYDEHAAFIGLRPDGARRATYTGLRSRLGDGARAFWDRNLAMIERGVLYAGRWERFLRMMVAPAACARRALIARVFACTSVAEQEELWLRAWNTPRWDRYLGILANRFLWTRLLREPGMRHIPRDLDIVRTVRERFDRAAGSYLFRDSAWAWLVFTGALSPDGPLPPHLAREHHAQLAAHAHRVKPITDSLLAYARRPEAGRFAAFSVSDFGSYADDASYRETYAALAGIAQPAARVCERQFLVPRDPSQLPDLRLTRDAALELALARRDHAVVYDFVAGVFSSHP